PGITTVADIADTRGQMTFFDRLIANDVGARIIDLSHRVFKNFFTVVQAIRFFEEARCRSIEPLILFIIDPDPRSAKAYGTPRSKLSQVSLLPVRNKIKTAVIPHDVARPNANIAPTSLDIPLLTFPLRALVDRQSFSFSRPRGTSPADLPVILKDELSRWVERVFFQFRTLELILGSA